MAVSKFYFSIAGLAGLILAIILVIGIVIALVSASVDKAVQTGSQKRSSRKQMAKLEKLAAEQGLVFTDQLFYAPCGVSVSVDRRARKIVLFRNAYSVPIILDMDAVTHFSVQNDLDAFWDLHTRFEDVQINKVLHQEAVVLAYKASLGKPIAAITLKTAETAVVLPFFIPDGRSHLKKETLEECARALNQFSNFLYDLLK